MTGPNLATRASAAISRRRQAPAAQAADARGTEAPGAQAPGERAPDTQAPAGEPQETGSAAAAWPARAAAVLGRHWLVTALLAAGLVLRAVTAAAYHPALIYVDTLKYLYGASPGSEPLGYMWLLRVILAVGDLGTVAALQHLLGLAMGLALYVVLLRRGVSRWLAALAAAPVLLDAYQLQMEHMIMPDVWFEAAVVAGLAVLLWRPAVTVPFAGVAGLILGASATIMQLGAVMIVPAVLYLLAAGRGWRRAASTAAVLALGFVLVIGAHGAVSYAKNGHFRLAGRQSLTGRLAAAADCATLTGIPPAARALCPTPAQQAVGPDWLEHSGSSPLHANPVPAGAKRYQLINDLNTAVLSQQPLRVAASIARDSVRLFALTREPTAGVTPISRWQFQDGYPSYPPWVSVCPGAQASPQACMTGQQAVQRRLAPVTGLLVRPGGTIVVGVQGAAFSAFHAHTLKPGYGGPAQVDRPLAAFLRAYQLDGGYTPGPLLALCALAGLAGSALLLSRRTGARTRQLALACLLFTGSAAVVLLVPDIYEFSWRYELPAVITLVPAGALGLAALASYFRPAPAPAGGPGGVAGEEPAPAAGGGAARDRAPALDGAAGDGPPAPAGAVAGDGPSAPAGAARDEAPAPAGAVAGDGPSAPDGVGPDEAAARGGTPAPDDVAG